MTHTPTPWELRQSTRLGYWFADCQQGGEGYTVTKFDCDEENAAFIVRAVNSHDALIKALDACITELSIYYDGRNDEGADANDVLTLAAKTLADAMAKP